LNLKEGTRRLAVLVGLAGVILGAFASYIELQSLLSQKVRHNAFEQLTASDVVKHERTCRLLGYTSGCSQIELPPSAVFDRQSQADPYAATAEKSDPPLTVQGPDGKTYQFPPGTDKAAEIRYFKRKGIRSDPFAAIAEPSSSDVPAKFSSESITPLASEVNIGEIKTINWTMGTGYGVQSIETQDGQIHYPTPLLSAWRYLLIALLPILGFFIPWGTIRAIGWVGAGFVASSK